MMEDLEKINYCVAVFGKYHLGSVVPTRWLESDYRIKHNHVHYPIEDGQKTRLRIKRNEKCERDGIWFCFAASVLYYCDTFDEADEWIAKNIHEIRNYRGNGKLTYVRTPPYVTYRDRKASIKKKNFYVVEFIDKPYADVDKYCVIPNSWLQIEQRILPTYRYHIYIQSAQYPLQLDPLKTKTLVKKNKDIWDLCKRFFKVSVEFACDSLHEAERWIEQINKRDEQVLDTLSDAPECIDNLTDDTNIPIENAAKDKLSHNNSSSSNQCIHQKIEESLKNNQNKSTRITHRRPSRLDIIIESCKKRAKPVNVIENPCKTNNLLNTPSENLGETHELSDEVENTSHSKKSAARRSNTKTYYSINPNALLNSELSNSINNTSTRGSINITLVKGSEPTKPKKATATSKRKSLQSDNLTSTSSGLLSSPAEETDSQNNINRKKPAANLKSDQSLKNIDSPNQKKRVSLAETVILKPDYKQARTSIQQLAVSCKVVADDLHNISKTVHNPTISDVNNVKIPVTADKAKAKKVTTAVNRRVSKTSISTNVTALRSSVSQEELADNNLCVALMRTDNQELTELQATAVKNFLESEILANLNNGVTSIVARFKGNPITEDGVLKLWCEDESTLAWLKKTVASIPVEKCPRLVVKQQSEVSRKVRAVLILPNCVNSLANSMKLLEYQNEWAPVSEWSVYEHDVSAEGSLRLVLGIPESIVPLLLSKGRTLAYSLGTVNVYFEAEDGSLQDEPLEPTLVGAIS